MRIQNIGNQNSLGPRMQNTSLQTVINQLNAVVCKKQNFDIVDLSKKAQELLKESKDTKAKEKEPVINYENSDVVNSTRWGTHTKAEFAEMSLDSQRNDLKTFSDEIDYAKSKLEFTVKKISELENYLNGTSPYSDPNMTRKTAEAYLYNYKQSIVTDYANFTFGKDQYHADELDQLSGGLASKVFENPLHSLNAAALGLTNLSSDPKEIMAALENASKMLNDMSTNLETAFAKATGGKGFQAPAQSLSIFDGNSSLDFFASQMEKDDKIVNADLNFSGETLEIGVASPESLEVAVTTP
ncbi:MAG: hypothetical protein PHG73_11650 [Pygmaiobacter sp.]|nr:hypothetical protein [Pygmaiobacter sp.]